MAPSDDACAFAEVDPRPSSHYVRRVARDNTVRFPSRPEHPLFFQILPGPGRRSYAKEWVELRQYPDDSIAILHDGQTLAQQSVSRPRKITLGATLKVTKSLST